MKKMLFSICTIAMVTLAIAQDARQLRRERIQASYMLALGRAPQESEITYWQGRTDASTVADFVKNHKTYIGQDAGTRTAVIRQAYNDAMGRNPSADEIKYWSAYNQTYAELMKNHVQWLSGNAGEYEKVIRNSYQFVLNRQPSAAEISYWRGQGTLSYVMLVGCHEDWKKRNAASAPKTSGPSSIAANSSFVRLVPLSATIAAEVKTAAGVVAAGAGNVIAAGAGNVVAAGAGNVVAAGAGNVVAAGAGN